MNIDETASQNWFPIFLAKVRGQHSGFGPSQITVI